MKSPTHTQDRRQFGRRTVSIHGWVIVEGRPRIPCVVRNISVEGAMLDFETVTWLPYYFKLVIEASRFESECELRHQAPNSVGVRFVRRRDERVEVGRHDINEVAPWLAQNRS